MAPVLRSARREQRPLQTTNLVRATGRHLADSGESHRARRPGENVSRACQHFTVLSPRLPPSPSLSPSRPSSLPSFSLILINRDFDEESHNEASEQGRRCRPEPSCLECLPDPALPTSAPPLSTNLPEHDNTMEASGPAGTNIAPCLPPLWRGPSQSFNQSSCDLEPLVAPAPPLSTSTPLANLPEHSNIHQALGPTVLASCELSRSASSSAACAVTDLEQLM